MENEKNKQSSARIESDSIFYNRVVPMLIIGMGAIMAVLIVIALGVLLGFVPFR